MLSSDSLSFLMVCWLVSAYRLSSVNCASSRWMLLLNELTTSECFRSRLLMARMLLCSFRSSSYDTKIREDMGKFVLKKFP